MSSSSARTLISADTVLMSSINAKTEGDKTFEAFKNLATSGAAAGGNG